MSEVESNQETNGTTNGDVPEIELIIKEEYACESVHIKLEWADTEKKDSKTHAVINAYNAGDYSQVHEKENLQKERKIVVEKENSPRREVLGNHQMAPALILTRQDVSNGAFNVCFDYVKPEQQEIQFDAGNVITKRYDTNDLSNPTSETATTVEARSDCDFASVVAEACEGLFDDFETEQDPTVATTNQSKSKPKKSRSNYNPEAVKLAVTAVLHGGLSLGQAAKKYNVVRSTVWAHVSRNPNRRRREDNRELQELICRKLTAGMTISEVSRSLHVPKSTVHLAKTRLKEQGMLPPVWVKNGKKDVADSMGVQQRLQQAYRGHLVNGMSVRFAAEFFELPVTTLWRYIKRQQAMLQGTAESCEKITKGKPKTEIIDSNITDENDSNIENAEIVDEDSKVVNMRAENGEEYDADTYVLEQQYVSNIDAPDCRNDISNATAHINLNEFGNYSNEQYAALEFFKTEIDVEDELKSEQRLLDELFK